MPIHQRSFWLILLVLFGWLTPASAQTTVLSDTFTDAQGTSLASHTMNVGSGWTIVDGSWTVDDVTYTDVAIATTNAVTNLVRADAGAADVTISADLTMDANSTHVFGLIGRVVDATNYIQLALINGVLSIDQVVAGVATTLDSVSVTGFPSSTKTFTLTLSGTAITASAGAYNLSGSSSAGLTETKHGLMNFLFTGSSYYPAFFDNFLVTIPGGGGGGGGAGCSLLLCGAGQ